MLTATSARIAYQHLGALFSKLKIVSLGKNSILREVFENKKSREGGLFCVLGWCSQKRSFVRLRLTTSTIASRSYRP